eukprot:TCALIF_05350-PA protein Name:"Protein of unknown function" AED:0.64 eAED:0.64 QI:241/0/0.33/0.33/1/1/3/0/146
MRLEQMSNPSLFFFRFSTKKTRMTKAISRHLIQQSLAGGGCLLFEGRTKFKATCDSGWGFTGPGPPGKAVTEDGTPVWGSEGSTGDRTPDGDRRSDRRSLDRRRRSRDRDRDLELRGGRRSFRDFLGGLRDLDRLGERLTDRRREL